MLQSFLSKNHQRHANGVWAYGPTMDVDGTLQVLHYMLAKLSEAA